MIDILFVVPAFKPKLEEESVGTLILAKKAILAGFSAQIIRYWQAVDNFDDYDKFKYCLINDILAKRPKVVSFYCRCTEYHICIDVSKELRSLDRSITIVFGGPQSEIVAEDTLSCFHFIDYICCSEGEKTIVPFLHYLNGTMGLTSSPSSIPGLVYRDVDGNIYKNEPPKLLDNDYKCEVNYYDIIPNEVIRNSYRTTIDVGRGCPYSCTFCSTKTFWKRHFRLRNVKDVVDEIVFVMNSTGIRRFDFDHDIFTMNKNKVMEFCHELNSRNVNISWYCSSRIDSIDKELIDIMVENGLFKIMFGIESASDRIQKIIKKNICLDSCIDIIKYCQSKGLTVIVSFIYGLPDDTEEDFEKTFRMMQYFQSLGVHVLTFLCGILNGTDLFFKYKNELVFRVSIW